MPWTMKSLHWDVVCIRFPFRTPASADSFSTSASSWRSLDSQKIVYNWKVENQRNGLAAKRFQFEEEFLRNPPCLSWNCSVCPHSAACEVGGGEGDKVSHAHNNLANTETSDHDTMMILKLQAQHLNEITSTKSFCWNVEIRHDASHC